MLRWPSQTSPQSSKHNFEETYSNLFAYLQVLTFWTVPRSSNNKSYAFLPLSEESLLCCFSETLLVFGLQLKKKKKKHERENIKTKLLRKVFLNIFAFGLLVWENIQWTTNPFPTALRNPHQDQWEALCWGETYNFYFYTRNSETLSCQVSWRHVLYVPVLTTSLSIIEF